MGIKLNLTKKLGYQISNYTYILPFVTSGLLVEILQIIRIKFLK